MSSGRRRTGTARASIAVAAVLPVLLAGCAGEPARPDNGVAVVRSTADDGFAGNLLERPYPKPAGAFTDTAGRPFDWSATKPVTIVFFGYTHCPDICNTVMADVASALRRVDPQVRRKVDVVFVTTDPARDTGPVIRRWLDAFDPAFVGLTAPLPTIEKSAETLGVGLTGNTPLPGGGYEVGHGTPLIGFDATGKGRVVWTEGTPVGGLRRDIERLAAAT